MVVYVADDKLSDDQVPELFRGHKWATSRNDLVKSVAQSPELTSSALLGKRPANVFWLAHDLTRAIHMASFESHERSQVAERIVQAIHHLEETGLHATDERTNLVRAWALAKSTPSSGPEGRRLADKVASVRNDIVAKIVALQRPQGGFSPYPSSERKNRIAEEAGLARE